MNHTYCTTRGPFFGQNLFETVHYHVLEMHRKCTFGPFFLDLFSGPKIVPRRATGPDNTVLVQINN